MNLKKEDYDVIIVGAGPAGSTCAALLGKKYKVLLIDKETFARDKACGDGISSRCLPLLRKLGILQQIESVPHKRIYGVTFSSPDGTIVEFPTPKDKEGKQHYFYCSRREVFDAMLFEHAKKNTSVLEQFSVTDVLFDKNSVIGIRGMDVNNNTRDIKAKVVVGADGALSLVRKKAGLEPKQKSLGIAVRGYVKGIKNLSSNIEIHYLDSVLPGYFWIFPVEDNLANIGILMPEQDTLKKNIDVKELLLQIINTHPAFKERFKGSEIVSQIKEWQLPFGNKIHSHKVYRNGMLLIGDAASLIEPFVGEGISYAMKSGEIASSVIEKALEENDVSEKTLKEYDREIRKILGSELRIRYFLQRLATNKFLLNTALHKTAKSKEAREIVSNTLIKSAFSKHYLPYLLFLSMRLLFS